jgi:hypothetical protein
MWCGIAGDEQFSSVKARRKIFWMVNISRVGVE